MVSLIWAQAANRVIGSAGALPWRLPEDLARFRALTIGSTVLMGRATWDSLPSKARPLIDRHNLVLSRRAGWSAPGATRVASIAEGIDAAVGPLWVIGGSQVYATALPYAMRIVMTQLADDFEGDVLAPALDLSWHVIGHEPATGWCTSAAGLRYRVITYERQPLPRDTVGL